MLLEALQKYCPDATCMHMPGHMRSKDYAYLNSLAAAWDITEIDGFDDLHNPSGILLRSMEAAAKLWGSEYSRYLVNGSTCGILACVYALGKNGGRAVVARNAHKSLYHALEITGVEPTFVLSGFDRQTGACTDISPESIEKALDDTPDARFVFLTSPTYEGVISDVERICEIAHRRNVPVIVDEAHGAHLGLTDDFRHGAVKAGADIVIQSLHKTLLSLTQTAIMHISGKRVIIEEINHALDIFETSSPSYLLMASIDGCVETLTGEKEKILHSWRTNIDEFRAQADKLKSIRLWKPQNAFAFDESKLVIHHSSLSGVQLMRLLRERFSVELEAAYPRYAVAMTGAGTSREALNKLLSALIEIDKEEIKGNMHAPDALPPVPERVYSVKDALGMKKKMVKADEAAGCVSAEYAWAYPPGVAVIAPGERIGREQLEALKEFVLSGVNTVTTFSEEGFLTVIDN